MKKRQIVVLATAVVAFLFLCGGVVYKATRPVVPFVLNLQGQPSIGLGKMEIVIFEDFRCHNCRTFTEEIFPQLTSLYVDTGKARLVFIPIAFDGESMPLANAALSVYRLSPERFIPFVLQLSLAQTGTLEGILGVAEKVGGIPLAELSTRIAGQVYYAEIDRNLLWARSVWGEEFGTPTLLINGIEISTQSAEIVVSRIAKMEKRS
jgi:protein-disulfide isomerase